MEPAPDSSAAPVIRVLVIDDSKVIRHVVQSTLRKRGWEVETASGGTEAIGMLAGVRPDVVVCDLNMPEMDGVEVVRRLGQIDPMLPVVMHSDEGELARVLGTVHQGAFDFIPKSKDLTALGSAVERAAKHGFLVRDNRRLTDELRSLNQALERRVEERTAALDASVTELRSAQAQLVRSEKFSALGQLAAGVAHEINTPVQFIGDSIAFLEEAFDGMHRLIAAYRSRCAAGATIDAAFAADIDRHLVVLESEADLPYILEQAPQALDRSREGVSRVAAIVRAMKEFAHPGQSAKAPADINDALRRTLTMAGSELKHVADVETDLGELPPVTCNIGELNQVFLNILINAAHAMADRVRGTGGHGHITVRTRREPQAVVVSIQDTGGGIPAAIRDRIFDPFFTTKEVGRGSGIGLALARSVVVDKHGGRLTFETEEGVGTTFFVVLPLEMS